MSMDGIQHRNNRTVTHRLFSCRAVNTFAEKFRTIAAMLVERALDREAVDFIGDIACYMPLHAASELLGIPAEDREQVLACAAPATGTNGVAACTGRHARECRRRDFALGVTRDPHRASREGR